MTASLRIWVLTDGRAGNESQSLGIAEKLELPYEVKQVRYTALSRLYNKVLGASLLGIAPHSRRQFTPPWPDIVIAAGRRLAPVALFIKKQNPGARLVQIMWPGPGAERFDLLVLPEHDAKTAPNIMVTPTAPHRLTLESLMQEAMRWRDKVAHLPAPRSAVLVGGGSKDEPYTDADYRRLAELASAQALAKHGSLMITTSRRTERRGTALLRQYTTAPHVFYDYAEGSDNPYRGFLGLADEIVVTGESMSMCSEAAFTGKPVYIFEPQTKLSAKHRRLHLRLYDEHRAVPLGNPPPPHWNASPPEDATRLVAREIRRRFHVLTPPAKPSI